MRPARIPDDFTVLFAPNDSVRMEVNIPSLLLSHHNLLVFTFANIYLLVMPYGVNIPEDLILQQRRCDLRSSSILSDISSIKVSFTK